MYYSRWQTALVDNPELTVRHTIGKNPVRVVIDTSRKLPLTLNIFNDQAAETIILCSNKNFEKSNTSFAEFIPLMKMNLANYQFIAY